MKVKKGVLISVVSCIFILGIIFTVKAQNSKASYADYLIDEIKISSIDTTRFNLTWEKFDEVEKYWILKEKANGYFEKIAEVNYPNYSRSGCNPGTYIGKFAVMAENEECKDTSNIAIRNSQKTVKVLTLPESISGLKQISISIGEEKKENSYVELEWNKCRGANKYYVYVKRNKNDFELVHETKNNKAKIFFTYDEQLKSLKYKVESSVEIKGMVRKGQESQSIDILTEGNSFNLKQVPTYKENSITISWNSGFDCSMVYIYTRQKEGWKKIASSNSSKDKYVINNLQPGTTLEIQIRDKKGKCIETIKAVTAPEKLDTFKVKEITDNSAIFNWVKEKGVSYGILRFNNSTKKYDFLRNVYNVDTYKCSNLYGNTTYEYIVAPIIANPQTGEYYYSLENPAKVTFKTALDTVKNVKIIGMSDDSVRIAWNKVKTATGYNIYVYDRNNNLLKKESIKECSYTYDVKQSEKIDVVIKVEAYIDNNSLDDDNKQTIVSYKKAEIAVNNNLNAPSNLRTSERVKGYVKLVWSSVVGAQKYEVFIVNKELNGNKKYIRQGTTKTLHMEFEKEKLEDNTIFVVKALSENKGEQIESVYSDEYTYNK